MFVPIGSRANPGNVAPGLSRICRVSAGDRERTPLGSGSAEAYLTLYDPGGYFEESASIAGVGGDTGRLFYDADGSGAGVSIMIATLTAAPALNSAAIFVT